MSLPAMRSDDVIRKMKKIKKRFADERDPYDAPRDLMGRMVTYLRDHRVRDLSVHESQIRT